MGDTRSYQGMDYVGLIRKFGNPRRCWDFRSVGRGSIDFEAVIRALNEVGYDGPLSVEFEDPIMDRQHGAREGLAFVRDLDFTPARQIQN